MIKILIQVPLFGFSIAALLFFCQLIINNDYQAGGLFTKEGIIIGIVISSLLALLFLFLFILFLVKFIKNKKKNIENSK